MVGYVPKMWYRLLCILQHSNIVGFKPKSLPLLFIIVYMCDESECDTIISDMMNHSDTMSIDE